MNRAASAASIVSLLLLTATGCASEPPPAPVSAAAAPSAPSLASSQAAEAAIAHELDDFNDAAAKVDEARYFDHFAKAGVFLGTDATERWDVAAFRVWAHPHFAKGKAWSFRATRRALAFASDARTAWFDEDLATVGLGPARGSGVMVFEDGRWKIAQYNLALTIPNERFEDVHAVLQHPPLAAWKTRMHDAYAAAQAAAEANKMADAEHALEALLDEAERLASDEHSDAAFWLHNALTWLRWSEGDLTGALREIDGAKSALLHARIPDPDGARIGLHEKWDRAYILLEMALAGPPAIRAQSLAAAEAARADYVLAAKPLDDHDGMAVLDAFFAVRRHNDKQAVAAAKLVDGEKDSDLQDLYILALALDRGGAAEKAHAKSIRAQIMAAEAYLMKPLIVRQMAVDAARAK